LISFGIFISIVIIMAVLALASSAIFARSKDGLNA